MYTTRDYNSMSDIVVVPEIRIESLNRRPRKGSRMAEDADEESGVELGAGPEVEGAPISRIAERLTWAIQKSEIDRKAGEELIRTPDGPRELSEILAEIEETYFPTRQSFRDAVESVIGSGPVETAEE